MPPWIDKEQYAFVFAMPNDADAKTAIALADPESEIEHCLLPFPIQSIRAVGQNSFSSRRVTNKMGQKLRDKLLRNSATIIEECPSEMQSIIGIRLRGHNVRLLGSLSRRPIDTWVMWGIHKSHTRIDRPQASRKCQFLMVVMVFQPDFGDKM